MTITSDESANWAAALRNDGDAFASIFDLHHGRVYRHALCITTNVHDAEDVTAAAFLELWRRRDAVRVVDGSVLAWLLVTATNISRNLTRGLRRHRRLIASLPRATTAPSAEDVVVDHIEVDRIDARLRESLRAISPTDAALISLIVFEHYSPVQAAAALGIADGAARTRLHRARSRLSTVFEELKVTDQTTTAQEARP